MAIPKVTLLKNSNWSFYTQILSRALNELEAACLAKPESQEFQFYRSEAPVVLEEAREALSALRQHMEELDSPRPTSPPSTTRH